MTNTPTTIFVSPASLGYEIQGLSLLDTFLAAAKGDLVVETDARLIPLFARSYDHPALLFVAMDPSQRSALPNNGKPDNADDMRAYFKNNAERLATRLGIDEYQHAALLRPDIAPPFNAASPITAPAPRPRYLKPDAAETSLWRDYLLSQDSTIPVLLTWNKGFSQHDDAARQNLDANDVAFLIRELHNGSRARFAFFNAMHGISADDYAAVNTQLPENVRLEPLLDPKTGTVFDLGKELDRYAAAMSAAKSLTGVMIGVGNTYQHLWYATHAPIAPAWPDQILVLPHGNSPVKPTWELQAAQPHSPTLVVSKSADFAVNRKTTLTKVAQHYIKALGI